MAADAKALFSMVRRAEKTPAWWRPGVTMARCTRELLSRLLGEFPADCERPLWWIG
jgi:hypothetical protein